MTSPRRRPPRYRPLHHRPLDETTAVTAHLAGDPRALPVLVRAFDRAMRRSASRYLSCADDIDDAVQDAWFAFARKAGSIHTPLAIGGWLCVTASHAAITIAQRRSRAVLSDHETLDRLVFDPADLDPLVYEEELRLVREAVARLDARDREFIELVFGGDASYTEIAAQTGRAIGGIGPTRARVTAKLRRDPAIRALAAER